MRLKRHYRETIKLLFLRKQLYLLMLPLTLLVSTYVFLGTQIRTSLDQDQKITVVNRNGKNVASKIIINKFEDGKYSYRVDNKYAKVQINKSNINPEESENIIYTDNPISEDKDIKTSVLFVEDTGLEFESAEVTLTKKAGEKINAILTCPTWDFDREKGTCNNWQIAENIVPTINGNSITFNVDHFSAYAGAYLEILNVQTNLTVGDIWEVRFNTYGTSDLKIEAINDTVYGEDVEFIEFYCGDDKIENVFDGNKVSINNYSCDNKLSRLVDRSVTPGSHHLQFTFGDSVETAKNFACNVGTLNDTCEVTTLQTETNGTTISGTGNLVIKSGGNIATAAGDFITIDMDGDVTVESGGNITANLTELTATNLDVQLGGNINVSSKGYTSNNGPGKGTIAPVGQGGGGGGYGGAGGNGESGLAGGSFYGSLTEPIDLGSAGGSNNVAGGSGGGVVIINITGTTTINGSITANGGSGTQTGTSSASGGGAGGSINLTTNTLAGSGSLSAIGGNGGNTTNADGGGGGGGRISLLYTTKTFNGSALARSGTGPDEALNGAAGTIYEKPSAQVNGDLTLANGDNTPETTTQLAVGTYTFETLNITGGTYFDIQDGVTISVTNTFNPTGNYFLSNTSSTGSITYPTPFDLTTTGTTTKIEGGTDEWPIRDLTVSSGTLNLVGSYSLRDAVIETGATLTHEANTSSHAYDLQLTISGNLTVSGSININSKGYASNNGPGKGTIAPVGQGGGGGGYGGSGGDGESGLAGGSYYGSLTEPVDLGSAGGSNNVAGGAGGGAAILNVTGTTTINGSITANGGNGTQTGTSSASGGGAGGTIYLATNTLAGTGSITGNGGNGGNTTFAEGGGGGGGRIALLYTTKTFDGSIQAGGGTGPDIALDGAAGTIYEKSSAQTNGNLTMDNSGKNPETPTQLADGSYTFETLNITGGTYFDIQDGLAITVTNAFNPTGSYFLNNTSSTGTVTYPTPFDLTTTGTTTIIGGETKWPFRDITVSSGTLTMTEDYLGLQDLTVSTGTLTLNGSYSVRDVVIETGAVLTHSTNAATQVNDLELIASGDLTINGTGSINVNAKGYAATSGPGEGADNFSGSIGASGAGYGGAGGNGQSGLAGGINYGSLTAPVDLGSGGGSSISSTGGTGGGAVILNIAGTTTINGSITANGTAGTTGSTCCAAGGGSGGTVNITTGTLAGSGNITANGGNGANTSNADGGGGGGGRIALYYTTKTHNGSVQAGGGTGPDAALDGAAGTIFEKPSAQTDGTLTIDNSGKNLETPTQLLAGTYTFDTLNITGGAYFSIQDGVTISVTDTFNPTGNYILSNTSSTGTIAYPDPFDLTTTGTTTKIEGGTEKWPIRDLTVSSGTMSLISDYSFRNVTIGSEAVLTHEPNSTTHVYDLQLTISGDLTVNGNINVNAKGFTSNNGPGKGTSAPITQGGGGAGYGGVGGNGQTGLLGGPEYGSETAPVDIGSGGGNSDITAGGTGGGAIIISVSGTAAINGPITANGVNGTINNFSRASGGGSGGTVSIITGALSGTADITSNGGNGGNAGSTDGGGGAGGRILLFTGSSTYTGNITATGGIGSDSATDGEDGTIYTDYTNPTTSVTAVCSVSGNGCTPSGTLADPQEAYLVQALSGTIGEPDTTVENIQLSIQNTTSTNWYDPNSGAFDSATEVRFDPTTESQTLPFTGSVDWTLSTGSIPWAIDNFYEINVIGSNLYLSSSESITFMFSNSPPTVSNVTASQNSGGTVDVTYDVTDVETSTTTVYLAYDIGTTLTSDMDTSSSAFAVSDASRFPNSGTVVIGNEFITYTGKSGNTLNGTITRGALGTTVFTHSEDDVVWLIATDTTGDTGTVENGSDKSFVWTAKTDQDGLDYDTMKIRVIANDGASSSMIGTEESASFAIDVKDPEFTDNFKIDASLATPLIYVPCTDESVLQMKLGTNSDLSGVASIAYQSSINFADANIFYEDGVTVYGQCVDAHSNTTEIRLAALPGIPSNIFFQDVSNPTLEDWRIFIAWGVVNATPIDFKSYNIYRREDGGAYSLLTTITDRQTNHYVDIDLDATIEYTYRINSEDVNGNISAYSATITDTPNGSGGTDLSVPTITGVSVSGVSTTQATITWTTNKFSNSIVYLEPTSDYPGGDKSLYSSSQGNPSVVTSHTVIVSGLSPNTTYSFLVESTDPGDNIASSANPAYQFTTEPGPEISNVSVTQVFDNEAVITWKTNIPSNSAVVYSKNANLAEPTFTAGSEDLVENHSITLTGLDIGSNYYFYVRSTDNESNTTEDKNIVNGVVQYYVLSTTIDTQAPVISNVETALTGEKGATITWLTNEPATSIVNWGTTADLGQTTSITNLYTTSHSISLLSLSANTKYFYQVSSADRSSNTTTHDAILSFTTNDVTTVEVPGEPGDPTEEQLEDFVSKSIADIIASASESILRAVLAAILDNNNLEDLSEDDLSEFLAELSSNSITGPTIGGTNLTIEPGATSAVVSWVTDRPANSLVAYVQDSEYNPDAEDPYALEVGNSSASVTEHSVTIEGLVPETTYHIQSRSRGSFGPLAVSPDNVFSTTPLVADINNIRIDRITESSVLLRWETTIPTRSRIIITDSTTGEARTYDNANFIRDHSFETEELNPSTDYTAQVISIDEAGNETESSIVSFTTVLNNSAPSISDVRVVTSLIPGKVEQVQTIISWRTNKPSTSKVVYDEGVRPDGELRLSIPQDDALRREHIIISSSFSPGKVYSYRVESEDTGGNIGSSQNYTLLTPRPRESVIDLIIKNLEEMFGFLR